MIDTNTNPSLVVGHVVNTVRNRLAQVLVFEIVDPNLLGITLRPPFIARILEISHQFLLFRIHRHHWLAPLLHPPHLLADVFELGITIWVAIAFTRLAIGLQTVTGVMEQASHGAVAHGMALRQSFPPASECSYKSNATAILDVHVSMDRPAHSKQAKGPGPFPAQACDLRPVGEYLDWAMTQRFPVFSIPECQFKWWSAITRWHWQDS